MKDPSGGTTLDQIIDSAVLLNWRSVMEEWNIHHPSIKRYKPMFAADTLYGNVLEEARMENSDDVLSKLGSLRRKHRVPKIKTEISYNAKEFIAYL